VISTVVALEGVRVARKGKKLVSIPLMSYLAVFSLYQDKSRKGREIKRARIQQQTNVFIKYGGIEIGCGFLDNYPSSRLFMFLRKKGGNCLKEINDDASG